jgi:hypothetical protein
MTTLPAIHHPAVSSPEEELPSFNLVMLYDREPAGKAAQRIIARLLSRCLPETDIHQDCWNFEDLAHAQFRKEASELAKNCDLMLVVTSVEHQLPFEFEVCSWFEDWTCTRIQKDAALVLLRLSSDQTVPARTFEGPLGLAPGGNLAVFTSALGVAAAEECASRATRRPSQLFYSPKPDGWGLNE